MRRYSFIIYRRARQLSDRYTIFAKSQGTLFNKATTLAQVNGYSYLLSRWPDGIFSEQRAQLKVLK